MPELWPPFAALSLVRTSVRIHSTAQRANVNPSPGATEKRKAEYSESSFPEGAELYRARSAQAAEFRTPRLFIMGSILPSRVVSTTTALKFLQKELHRPLDGFEVALNDVPQLVQINAEIFVHQHVSHGDDACPRDLGMRLMKVPAQLSGRLTDDLKVMDHPNLN